jgi:PleD family two-component response regulator
VALRRADAIVSDLAAQAWERTAGMQVTVSAGVAVGDPANLADLEGRADAALYEAKAGGGNRVARAAR